MLLLTARAGREIVNAVDATTKSIEANTATLERIEGEVGGVKEAMKDLKDEVGDVKESLRRIEELTPAGGQQPHCKAY